MANFYVYYSLSTAINCRQGNAGIAQLAEQLTCNQQVVGSSPIASSKHGGVPERPKGADCKSVVSDFSGSNPLTSTILNP
jgi:hypothetical protein